MKTTFALPLLLSGFVMAQSPGTFGGRLAEILYFDKAPGAILLGTRTSI